MTCKDCIHSGLCYKENDYKNFPDRCGDFISLKPHGEWIDYNNTFYKCPDCGYLLEKCCPCCQNKVILPR